jgi:hypothetical protein
MTTADVVRETALTLACSEKRVPVVLARQQFREQLEEGPEDPLMSRAAELLDRVLERLPAG